MQRFTSQPNQLKVFPYDALFEISSIIPSYNNFLFNKYSMICSVLNSLVINKPVFKSNSLKLLLKEANLGLLRYWQPIFKLKKLHMSSTQGPTNFNQPQSLVKYSNPVLVSNSGKKQVKDAKINPQNLANTYTQDILNSILPPRQYTTQKQQLWIQSVSATPATKQDVLDLQQKLDKRLQQRQARETGICPIRQELYSQCFDQLIRQITINCAERGLLLVRVRDQIRSTIQSYQTLYESSIAFGMRQALQAEQKKKDMQNKISTLKAQTKQLEEQVHELQDKIADMEVKDKEQQETDRQAHKNNVQSQKRTNQILKQELQKLLQGPQPAAKK